MFDRKIHLFSLFGFKVGLDITWIFLAVLITWSLATGLFPHYFEGMSQSTYWWMGIFGALGLFVSIVFHEFCHSLVARRFDLPMKGITLFLFGGVAEMNEEPQSPKSEFLMALAGPVSSIILGLVFLAIATGGEAVKLAKPVNAVMTYLMWLNFLLAGFNLLPAFPLDGGRILRSVLWQIKGNLRWATRIASSLGSGIGMLLIVLGVISFIGGAFVGGVWYVLIGFFIRSASQMSYKQMLVRRALGGEHVRQFMKTDPITVPASVSIEKLVREYFYKHHHKMYPVENSDGIAGCVTSKQIKQLPREQWAERTAKDIAVACSEENTVSPDTDAIEALGLMNKTGNSRLLVMENGRLAGVLTLKDMLKFLNLKIDLEQ